MISYNTRTYTQSHKYCNYIIGLLIYTKYGFRARTSMEGDQASI